MINERGYWEDLEGDHYDDSNMINTLINQISSLNIKTILDLGCGNGFYVKILTQNGFKCEAYDGNPYTETLTNGYGKVKDLSIPFDLDHKFDLVMSFEVGEHIPKEYESIFIDNICKHSNNLIILSWAIPGQGGRGHVNEQSNEYIINQISELLRKSASISWFKNTIMVFKKNK